MARQRKYTRYMADFETTVFEGQESTEVWAAACVEFETEDVKIFHSIREQYQYFVEQNENLIVYYHNLKFDGAFWLAFLMQDEKLTQAYSQVNNQLDTTEWEKEKDMEVNTFRYTISDMGQWYGIVIKTKYGKLIDIRDSLKLLPFSVKRIGQAFKTKHQKLEMEYEGFRYAGCTITEEEKKYIANDVLVVKEALEYMLSQGHDKTTIGACCLEEFKSGYTKEEYSDLFPDQYQVDIPEHFDALTAGDYIHKSYKGGWCYLVPGKAGQLLHNGTTADVNSLYPSMMSSESGNVYPYGDGVFWTGDIPPQVIHNPELYWFVRIRTRFYLKEGMLPFIQIKGNPCYKGNVALTTSDIFDPVTQSYCSTLINLDGEEEPTTVELTLTCTDYFLFHEHYRVEDYEELDGVYFQAKAGLFDEYIEKYKKIKLESKGAMRELAKLFLNNLYGKMASNTNSSFKLAYVKDDESIGFLPVKQHNKKPGYIPIGSAITSYARNFTIRAAQKNYYGPDKPGFVYADTDSIHCDLPPEQIKGIKVHDKDFCCWKLESCWDEGWFMRQKTYIEHCTHENLEPLETPYSNIKCAGMPQKCKDLFQLSMDGFQPNEQEKENYTPEELDFLSTKRSYEDFKVGLKVPGKLLPKRIKGGILLVETTYEMRPN